MNMLLKRTLLFLTITLIEGKHGYGPGDQDWGFVEVRPHAHMFWWMHFTTAEPSNPTNRPLLIWIQGGPGASSSGEGNIFMSGLVDENNILRNFSYVHLANVLYVDNPVGAGYSYVDTEKGGTFATNINELTSDFIELLKGFFKEHPEFEQVPLYLLGESFGGKFAPACAQKIHEEVTKGHLKANLKGVGMAYPATQLRNNIATMADVLLAASIIDTDGYNDIFYKVDAILAAIDDDRWVEAGNQLDELLDYIITTYNLDFFSVINNSMDQLDLSELNSFMNKIVSPVLEITRKFGVQRDLVSKSLVDKLQSTVSSVEYLLNNTDVKIAIYNGQLDWVVNTLGTYSWVIGLDWVGRENWNKANRDAFSYDGVHEGHYKKFDRLVFYWVKRSGHKLPNHNPNAMKYILKQLTGF